MENKRIFLSSPHMGGLEEEFIKEAFSTNWIAPLGPNVNEFEKEISEYVGINDAAALSTGTSAIHLALRLLKIEKGDFIFCSSLTFAASCNPIIYEKAIPIFIDSEEDSWNMSPIALEKAFEWAKDNNCIPKALIVVHLYGQSADMDKICELCNKYNVPIIEDAAESLGATYKGKQTGTIGEYGIYSFNGNKIITTSGGGMLVSDNVEGIKKARFLATQARDNRPYYHHTELGYNYRMSNIVAGIGRGQIRVLDERIEKKKEIFNMYKESFKDLDVIDMMPIKDYGYSNYWLSCMRIKKGLNIKPSDLIKALEDENIEARHIWKPMHMQPFYKDNKYFREGKNDISKEIFESGICLPSDTKMTLDEQKKVINIIKKVLRGALKLCEV
ncbi:MAG: DegT/DnrJ/EryC1/StrS family aminotransferase [Clostridium sp.]